MNNAVWLLLALPPWFLSALGDPLAGGPLTAVPAAGALCLFVGLLLAVRRPSRRLLGFLLPFALSESFIAASGLLRGAVADPRPALPAFLAAQLLLAGALIFFARRSPGAAAALAVFSMSYALFAAFVASMAFADNWL